MSAKGSPVNSVSMLSAKIADIHAEVIELRAERRADDREFGKIDNSLGELFGLHRKLAEDIAALRVSMATITVVSSGNTKTSDRLLAVVFTILTSVITALIVTQAASHPPEPPVLPPTQAKTSAAR